MTAVRRPIGHRPQRPLVGRREERGLVLLVVSMLMVMLVIIAALVVDIGLAKQVRRHSQNSADAAALAAAQDLDGTANPLASAVATAKAWARKNDPQLVATLWNGCVDDDALAVTPDAGNSCISFSADHLTVRVTLPMRRQPVVFGGAAGSTGLVVGATATATKRVQPPVSSLAGPCGLCIIGGSTLQIAGNTSIRVTGGEIQADRLTANAQDSNTAITPVPLRWYSTNSSNWGRNVQPSPAAFNARYAQLAAPVPNPFATKVVDYAGLPLDGSNINWSGGPTMPLQPGRIYTQNVNINGGTLDLAPGTYYFANTLTVQNGATVNGVGVTLVFTCRTSCATQGGEPGKFTFASGTTVNITAPTTGPYAGLAIMFDPDGSQGTPNQLSGNATFVGAIYGKKAGFNMGNSSATIRAWTVVAGGAFDANNGTLLIDNLAFADAIGGPSGPGASDGISLVG